MKQFLCWTIERFTLLSKVKVYVSKVHDPAFNLAFESYLLKHNTPDTMIFYLWQNDKTLVIGRHQNPYKECDLKKVKRDNVTVIRRPSGGGAVYHDLGNLNFTFIAGKNVYDVDRHCSVISDALKEFGFTCEVSGRNDMTIQGAKFSGHAYMNHEDMYCHHGTLLVNSDLKILSEYLTVSDVKLKSKGIDSVRSRVGNLSEIHSNIGTGNLNVELLKEVLVRTFLDKYPYVSTIEQVGYECTQPYVLETMQKFKTWAWNISESLEFDVSYENEFKWGLMELSLKSSNGIITDCDINSDCILEENFEQLKSRLIGTAFEKKEMIRVVDDCLKQEEIRLDLGDWFDELLFNI